MTQEDRHWQQHLTASVVGCRLCFPPIKQPTYMEKVELIKSFKTGENLGLYRGRVSRVAKKGNQYLRLGKGCKPDDHDYS
jgi:hypothetical protein